MELTLTDRLKKLLEDKNQLITMVVHANPDGDAIGSGLGLYAWLSEQGFSNVHVISPNPYASFLHWMPGNDQVIVAEKRKAYALDLISKADLLVCLDFNGMSRTAELEEPMKASRATKVMIDHHPDPENDFDLVISDTGVSSTAELLYECLINLSDRDAISLPAAQCLYAGIVTDTGSFSYGCNNPRTYEIVARLIETGVDGAHLHRLIYSTYSEDRMRLLGYCLSEKLKVVSKANTAYISLSKSDLQRFNHQEGDTEGIVNYALNIENIRFAALFTEKENHIKISFRSVGELDANKIARDHFNGGGHKNAAGGKSYASLNDTLANFESLIKNEIFSDV
ncbi:MAG: DHH family phosphoesterase [Bacteroidales bacterium]